MENVKYQYGNTCLADWIQKKLKIEHRATCLCKICKYFPGKYFDSVN